MRIGSIGERLDLLLRQGATFGEVRGTMTNPDGTPVNLTGCIIRGAIRKNALDTSLVVSITANVSDPVLGKYGFGLSAIETANMKAGESESDPESRYVWDLELEDSNNRVTPLYYGNVIVYREVTR